MKVRDAIAGVPRHSRGAAGCAATEDVVSFSKVFFVLCRGDL